MNIQAIKDRYPPTQVNALGKQDMDNIRWLITKYEALFKENERLQAENKKLEKELRKYWAAHVVITNQLKALKEQK